MSCSIDNLILYTVRKYPHRRYLQLEYYTNTPPGGQIDVQSVFPPRQMDSVRRFIPHQKMLTTFKKWYLVHGILSTDYIFRVTQDLLVIAASFVENDRNWSTQKTQAVCELFESLPPFDPQTSTTEVRRRIQTGLDAAFRKSQKAGSNVFSRAFSQPWGDDILNSNLRDYFLNSFDDPGNFYAKMRTFLEHYAQEVTLDPAQIYQYLQAANMKVLKLGIYSFYPHNLMWAKNYKLTREMLYANGAYDDLPTEITSEIDLILLLGGFDQNGPSSFENLTMITFDKHVRVAEIHGLFDTYVARIVEDNSLGGRWSRNWPQTIHVLMAQMNVEQITKLVLQWKQKPTRVQYAETRGGVLEFQPVYEKYDTVAESQLPSFLQSQTFKSTETNSGLQIFYIVAAVLAGWFLIN